MIDTEIRSFLPNNIVLATISVSVKRLLDRSLLAGRRKFEVDERSLQSVAGDC